jgi:hypothetical protein
MHGNHGEKLSRHEERERDTTMQSLHHWALS